MSEKLKVGILGATGMVGQRFVTLLENHPWFEVVKLAASAHSAGKTYEEAVGPRWKMETPMPEYVKGMTVHDVADVAGMADGVDFVFSAVNMSKDEIRAIEEEYAKTETPVVSNNSAHRWTPDVPMVVPEINPEHFAVIEHQRKRLGTTRGFIAVKPNCSIQAYTPALAAWKEFEPREVVVHRSTSSSTSPRMTARRSSSMWTTRAAWACQSAVCARIRSLTGSSWGWLTTRCAVPPAARSNAPKCSRRSVISARSDGSLPLRLKLRLETIKRPG